MHRAFALLLSLCALTALAALPAGEQQIRTKDGRTLRGVVLSETRDGYLFKTATGTEVVRFDTIEDLQPVPVQAPVAPWPDDDGPGVAPEVAPPPPPPPDYQPPPPLGTPRPPEGEPQPATPEPVEPPPPNWRAERKGFHVSVGLGGAVNPGASTSATGSTTFNVTGFVAARPAASWGLGWLDLHVELQPLGYFRGSTKALFVGVVPSVRVNFSRFYSLGVGPYFAVVMSPGVDFCAGLQFSPAIFKLGKRGEHELGIWGASPILATSNQLTGIVLMLISYSYVFEL